MRVSGGGPASEYGAHDENAGTVVAIAQVGQGVLHHDVVERAALRLETPPAGMTGRGWI